MQDLRRRSFRTVLAATVLSSALAVWAGVGPAAATVTPEPTGRVPRTADTPSKPVTKSKPVSRKHTSKPATKHAAKPATKKRMTAPEVPVARVGPTIRTLRKARTLDTFRYRLGVSAPGTRGYATATGSIEITDSGASNRGTFSDSGQGSANLGFTPIKDDGTNGVKKISSADDQRRVTEWTDDAKITSVRIRLCKVLDPLDPEKHFCRELTVPRG